MFIANNVYKSQSSIFNIYSKIAAFSTVLLRKGPTPICRHPNNRNHKHPYPYMTRKRLKLLTKTGEIVFFSWHLFLLMGIRHKDTKKKQSLDKIYKKQKYLEIKKRASSHEPLASVRKALKAFLLNCINVTQKSIFLFTWKINFSYLFWKLQNPIFYLYTIYLFFLKTFSLWKKLFAILLPNN